MLLGSYVSEAAMCPEATSSRFTQECCRLAIVGVQVFIRGMLEVDLR